jgi:glycerophosphoryl diester phosphodiesterase
MKAAAYPYFDVPFAAYAHRGGALYPPNLHRENTRHAFQQAVGLGYRYLETDVHATADRVLVAFHDDVLDRVTDRTGQIAQLPYAEVARARIGGLDPIPQLSELLSAFPDARFNIDAKSDASVDPLAVAIAEHQAYERVCVSSFSLARLHRLRRLLGPRVASAASSAGVAVNRFVPWLTWALNSAAPVLQLPVAYPFRGRMVTVLTPALVRAVHRSGKRVQIWTVDDSQTMERLIELGVDGIFTDRIDVLKDVLLQRGLWTEPDPEQEDQA